MTILAVAQREGMVDHAQPDWTINEALDYLSDLYPNDRKGARDALRLAARKARITITGCRCKWVNLDAIDIGEREAIRDLAWVDLAFEVRGRDWAAVLRHTSSRPVTTLPPAVAKLLVANQKVHAPRWPFDPTKSETAEGWGWLRLYRVEVLAAFPKPLKPNQAANLALFAQLAAPPAPIASTLSDKREATPAELNAPASPEQPSEPASPGIAMKKKRATIWKGPLANFLSTKRQRWWERLSDREVLSAFADEHPNLGLPVNTRSIRGIIAQKRAERLSHRE